MKIGILTYHRSHNYGTLLQAYALMGFLRSQGYPEVEFIDYFPAYHQRMYLNYIRPKPFAGLALTEQAKYPLYWLFRYLPLRRLLEKRRRVFQQFIQEHLIAEAQGLTGADYDVVIYGSDQIWRKQNNADCPGFNEMYFGSDPIRAAKRIAFSASMGDIDLSREDERFLAGCFERFSAISVREQDLLEAIQSFSRYPVRRTLDPVFLLAKEEWARLAARGSAQGKYILLYNLQAQAYQEVTQIAKAVGQQLGLPIIELHNIFPEVYAGKWPRRARPTAGPREFLDLVQHAEFVVASSFHGVAFSLLFQKQFYACLRSNSARVAGLLALVGLEDRLLGRPEAVDLARSIDYSAVNPRLEKEIKSSMDFLLGSIANRRFGP